MTFYTKTYTPLFNTRHLNKIFGGEEGNTLPLDDQGLLRAVETILLPKTPVSLIKEWDYEVVELSSQDYPYTGPFFTDKRFFNVQELKEQLRTLPSSTEIIQRLTALLGSRYLWGGNSPRVPQMLEWYPPKKSITASLEQDWTLSGFDCSGLIYYVTGGFTPRNTSSWLNWGVPISIETKSTEQIVSLLQPLDALVWKGHILFVIDKEYVIESRAGRGVVITDSIARINSLLEEGKQPRDFWHEGELQFLVRRWHEDFV